MTGAVRMRTISAENTTNSLPEELACREKQAAILSQFYNNFYAASTFYVFITSNLSRINIISIKKLINMKLIFYSSGTSIFWWNNQKISIANYLVNDENVWNKQYLEKIA